MYTDILIKCPICNDGEGWTVSIGDANNKFLIKNDFLYHYVYTPDVGCSEVHSLVLYNSIIQLAIDNLAYFSYDNGIAKLIFNGEDLSNLIEDNNPIDLFNKLRLFQ